MKTNYPLKSKQRNTNWWKYIVAAVIFLIITGFGFLFSNFTRSSLHYISLPLWLSRDVAIHSALSIADYFKFKSTLIARNQELEGEVLALKLKQVDYDLMLKENQDLKSELGRNADGERVITRVLSKPPLSPYDTVVVDVGTAEGIVLGNKAYMGENIVVGMVVNVTPRTSLVELFSNNDRKQEAVLSRTGTSFTLVGQGGGNMKLEVPKDTDIIWGDTFMYPTISSPIIGSVYYIDTNSQSSFKSVYVRVPFNVFSSKYLFIGQ